MWYTIMVTAWIGESHLLKWQKSSIAQNYIELPHFIMRHRQAVRQRTLTPPSQVRLLLAQLDKTPHGCLEHQVSMRGFFVSGFRRIKKRAFRHVRMDGTHTGKLSAESVRAALRRVRGSALNFVEKGDTRGEGFLSCAAGRNGSPLERGAFATRWKRAFPLGESPFGLPWKLAADQSSSSAPVYSW